MNYEQLDYLAGYLALAWLTRVIAYQTIHHTNAWIDSKTKTNLQLFMKPTLDFHLQPKGFRNLETTVPKMKLTTML